MTELQSLISILLWVVGIVCNAACLVACPLAVIYAVCKATFDELPRTLRNQGWKLALPCFALFCGLLLVPFYFCMTGSFEYRSLYADYYYESTDTYATELRRDLWPSSSMIIGAITAICTLLVAFKLRPQALCNFFVSDNTSSAGWQVMDELEQRLSPQASVVEESPTDKVAREKRLHELRIARVALASSDLPQDKRETIEADLDEQIASLQPTNNAPVIVDVQQVYRDALAKDPKNHVLYYKLASFYMDEEQDYHKALVHCDKAIRLHGSFALAHTLRARTLHKLGRLEEAIKAVRRAIRFDKEPSYHRSYLAKFLYEQGKTNAAMKAARKSLKEDPESSVALWVVNKIEKYPESNNPQTAREWQTYRDDVSLPDPNELLLQEHPQHTHDEVHCQFVLIFLKCHEFMRAEKHAELAVKYGKESSLNWANLWAALEAQEYGSARRKLKSRIPESFDSEDIESIECWAIGLLAGYSVTSNDGHVFTEPTDDKTTEVSHDDSSDDGPWKLSKVPKLAKQGIPDSDELLLPNHPEHNNAFYHAVYLGYYLEYEPDPTQAIKHGRFATDIEPDKIAHFVLLWEAYEMQTFGSGRTQMQKHPTPHFTLEEIETQVNERKQEKLQRKMAGS